MDSSRLALRRRWPVALTIAASSIAIAAVFGTVGIGSAATKDAPKNTKAPSISGTAQLDQTLTADPGTWSGTQPITFSYQWRRCDKQGNNCASIGGETARTYDIRTQDLGNTIRVRVAAKNGDGTARADSAQTDVVAKPPTTPPPTSNGCPSGTGAVSVSQLTSPVVLQIDGQSSDPSPITRSVSDLTMRVHVSACNGRSVTGALVQTTAIPFRQFSIPAEQTTGSDGWATLTLHRESAFPASPRQQILAVFIRARKPGDPILAGIAGRRLVSFPVRLH
jgi:hypothetical protein